MRPSEAARQLGVSIKALRLYERRGLLTPARTSAGYRVYGADAMARAAQIVALRTIGLSLSQIARMLDGDAQTVAAALVAHEQALEKEIRRLASTMDKVRALRAPESAENGVSFELPWPWAGERFELRDIRPINYIVGPLGSGKTRFAQRLAESLPGASFLGLNRLEGTDPLTALLRGLQAAGPVVVDMVEQGLDRSTQEALIADLRERAQPGVRPLFLMTRSSSILNLAAVGSHEAILYCPPNHSPPLRVAPYPGARGYESVSACLASPEVRARLTSVAR